jgi:primosomal replication protein N
MNRVELIATVLEREPVRYTPAGLPAIELLLSHVSEVVEAGFPRRIELTIRAVALGDLALLLADKQLGTVLRTEGFLAPARKDSQKLKLHLQRASELSAGGDPPSA